MGVKFDMEAEFLERSIRRDRVISVTIASPETAHMTMRGPGLEDAVHVPAGHLASVQRLTVRAAASVT